MVALDCAVPSPSFHTIGKASSAVFACHQVSATLDKGAALRREPGWCPSGPPAFFQASMPPWMWWVMDAQGGLLLGHRFLQKGAVHRGGGKWLAIEKGRLDVARRHGFCSDGSARGDE